MVIVVRLVLFLVEANILDVFHVAKVILVEVLVVGVIVVIVFDNFLFFFLGWLLFGRFLLAFCSNFLLICIALVEGHVVFILAFFVFIIVAAVALGRSCVFHGVLLGVFEALVEIASLGEADNVTAAFLVFLWRCFSNLQLSFLL